MARAIWKGVIRFGPANVPVKLLSAAQDRSVHFRLLHDKDHVPVEQRMINPVTGDIVPRERVRRGVEVEPGTFVMLDEDELNELEPEASRDIEITRFVDSARIGHEWYERPYWLAPDGDENDAYFALAQAMQRRNVEGIARWTMRKKPYRGALRARGPHLLLITLRHAGEVLPVSSLEAPAGRDMDAREIAMARQLVAALEGEFDPAAFRDEYRERVLELVQAKADGRMIEMPKAPEKRADTRSLADVLAASVETAKERAVA